MRQRVILSLFSLFFLLSTQFLLAEEESAAVEGAEVSFEAGVAPVSEVERQQLMDLGYAVDSQDAYLSLYLDKRYVGELLVTLDRDTTLSTVRYSDLLSLLTEKLPLSLLEYLGERQDLNGWIPFADLERLSPYFHLRELSLYLRTPAEEKANQTIDFEREQEMELAHALPPDPFSAYLNLRNVYSYASEAGHYLLDMDGAMHFRKWVAEGRFDFDAERDRTFDFYELRIIRDFPHNLTRLTIGEDQSFRPRLLASDQIYGIKYSTEFSVQPFLVTSPISEYSFLLERDSLVTIWVNGEKQKEIRLPAGPYDIRNFPLTTGFNEVTLELLDDLGNTEFLTFNAVSGPNLLAEGRSEFAYSVGNSGHGRTLDDKTIASIFHRRGINEWLTLSGEMRGDSDHQGAALGMDFVAPWLHGSVDAAVSHGHSRIGGLVRLILSRSFGDYHFNYRTDLQSKNYFVQSNLLTSERIRMTHLVTAAGPMPWGAGNIHASFSDVRKWLGLPSQKAEVRWDKLLNHRWRLECAYLFSRYDSTPHDFRVVVSYSMLGERVARSHTARIKRESQTIRSTITGKQSKGWWANWKASHYREWADGSKPTDSINGDVTYDGNRFSSYYSFWVDDVGKENDFRHNINLSTSLAYVDGHFAFGRPIRDSFAILTLHPDLPKDELQISRTGRTPWKATRKMGAVVSELRSYHPSDVLVESEDIEFETQQILLLPTYRSGTAVVAGAFDEGYGPLTVAGRLLDWDGTPVKYKAVAVTYDGSVDFAPLYTFTNDEGYFRLTGVGLETLYQLITVDSKPLHYEIAPIETAAVGAAVEVGELQPISLDPSE